jgi:cell division protein FtsZ
VKAVMAGMGLSLMGAGRTLSENCVVEATQQAISSLLLEEATIQGAKGVLINITGGMDLMLYEVNKANSIIGSATRTHNLSISILCPLSDAYLTCDETYED